MFCTSIPTLSHKTLVRSVNGAVGTGEVRTGTVSAVCIGYFTTLQKRVLVSGGSEFFSVWIEMEHGLV